MSKISSDDVNNFICNKCGRMIPIQNKDLHELRCVSLPLPDELPIPPPVVNNTITCLNCTFINPSNLLMCTICDSDLSNSNNDVINCSACSYLNPSINCVCEICGSSLKDELELKDYFESRADLYVKCPTVNCLQYIELSNPGQIERINCPDCQYCFCSQCREIFHGIPNSNYNGKSVFQERLTCDGARSILQRWRDYQTNGRIFSDDETAQKHHIDLKALVDSFGD
jgi:hypothetical protein